MTSGSVWKEQRRFALTVLREFGMGRLSMEEKIQNAITPLMEYLNAHVTKEIDPAEEISSAVANVIGNIIFGQEFYDKSSRETKRFIECIDENFRNMNKNNLEEDYPVLRLLPGDVCGMRHTMDNVAFMKGYFRRSIVWDLKLRQGDNIRDFTDAFLVKMAEMEGAGSDTNKGMFDGKSVPHNTVFHILSTLQL